MKYMGSKSAISHDIKMIIDINRKNLNQWYVEPFCGGCNMLDKMKGKRIAADNNKYLIALWKGLQANLKRPKHISKEMYDNAKKDFKNGTNEFYNDFQIGWIGFMASFNGKFFNGYSAKRNTKDGIRDYAKESINNIENQIQNLLDVNFYLSDYDKLEIPKNSVIYCDIPYFDCTKYVGSVFNHNSFYDWAEQKSKEGNKVFISEYWMPEDRFTKIWQKQIKSNLSTKTQNKIESLFIPKNQEVKRQLSFFDCL